MMTNESRVLLKRLVPIENLIEYIEADYSNYKSSMSAFAVF